MKMVRSLSACLVSFGALLLTSCVTTDSGALKRSSADVGVPKTALTGVITGKRSIVVSDSGLNAGAAVGAGTGAALGALIGGADHRGLGAGVGAAVGLAGGQLAGHQIKKKSGFEYEVRLDNGRMCTIADLGPELSIGQRVLVTEASGNSKGSIQPY